MEKVYTVRIDSNGTKRWYRDGLLDREDGPAVEFADGTKFWYVEGKCHRTDGPALEYADGNKYWFLEGIEMTKQEYLSAKKSSHECEDKIVEIDGIKYQLKKL